MSRPTYFYDLVLKLWPLSKVAFKLGKRPIAGMFVRPFFSTQFHQAVIIPVNEAIRTSESSTLPYALLEPLVRQSSARFVMNTCLCRSNEGCQHYPQDIGCLYLGDGAARINPGLGRQLTVDEALEHIHQGMQAGLVPLIAHTTLDAYMLGIPFRRMLTVCFCCDCCCAVRHGLRMGPPAFWDVVVRLPGVSFEVSDECIGCEACLPACSVQAIHMQEARAVIGEQCKGCGKCLEECPVGAIQMRVSNKDEVLGELMRNLEKRTIISK